jgi:hypothetical protein
MKAANNLCCKVFGLPLGRPMPLELEHGGKLVSLSEALTLADDASESPALDFQRRVFALLESHSMRDAISGDLHALDGLTAPNAGGGSDRRNYPEFTLRKLKHISSFFGAWKTMTETQRTAIKNEFAAAVRGEEYRPVPFRRLDYAVQFEPWPEDVCEVVMEAIKLRRKKK